jgi:hypothetical protein
MLVLVDDRRKTDGVVGIGVACSGALVVNTAIAVPRNTICRNGAAGTNVVPAHQHKRG